MTVDQLKQETTNGVEQSSESRSATEELNEFLTSSAGDKRVLVCTATANPGQVQYTWTTKNSARQNDTSTSSSSTSSSPATEKIITVVMGLNSGGSADVEGIGSLNRSVLILQDRVEVNLDDIDEDDDDNGKGNENIPKKSTEGVKTYICIVNNTVGWDQCTIQVQGKNIVFIIL